MSQFRKSPSDWLQNFIERLVEVRDKKQNSNVKVQLIVSSSEKNDVRDYFRHSDLTQAPNEKSYPLVKFANIKSGDFWIMLNDKLLYLFERKTFRDLCASLGDERWKSQKFKMQQMPLQS